MGMLRNRNRSGKAFWVDTYIIPIFANGELVEFQCIYRSPSIEMVRRAERIYELRKLGKEPPELRFPAVPVSWRSLGTTLIALAPAAAAALIPMAMPAKIALVGLSLLLAAGGSWLLTRQLTRQIRDSRRFVSHRLKQLIYTGTSDDIGQLELAQRLLQSQLSAILRRIQDTSGAVRRSSADSTRVMQETSGEIERQQDSLTQLATAMEQFASTTESVARTTTEALDQVDSVQQDARTGSQIVGRAIDSMQQLDSAMERINGNVDSLTQRSDSIGRVIEVIKDIAEQTNLLALNAAIEAARAGENGRGFAVVADEVRKLAQRTQASTSEINEMIGALQQETGLIAGSMQQGRELSSQSVGNIQAAGDSLQGILQAVDALKGMATQIATAAEEQNAVTGDINAQIRAISQAAESVVHKAGRTLALNRDAEDLADRQSRMVERVLAN
ncbi:methyl-accepting chemotaxis protein [Marinobacterium aestuariivivens]|uniref:Methyl-accepting chemotaxis protein n=1 Tax=Marinobacterium aestuariivivens TaxID=1698799 RepID=A0ABW2A921_9GAMM